MSHYMDDKTWLGPKLTQNGGHMIMENVKKPNQIKYLNIDTRFQQEYNLSKTATFIYNLPQKITDVKSIAVRSAEIPLSFTNFSLNRGNTYFKIDNSNILLPDSNYSATDLKTKFNTILPANMTMDISYNHCIISNTNTSSRKIYFDVDVSGGFNKYNLKSNLGWCLGFRLPEYTIPANSFIQSESIIDTNNIRYLYLVVDDFRQSNPNSFISPLYSSLMSKDILARITLNPSVFPFGSILPANTFNGYLLSDQRVYSGKTDIQKLKIQLVDEWGRLVDLNQFDFSFCLEIEHE